MNFSKRYIVKKLQSLPLFSKRIDIFPDIEIKDYKLEEYKDEL